MWSQANRNTLEVADIARCGWNLIGAILSIDWDGVENQAAVNQRTLLLMKVCKCKTGCTTGRCGCEKEGQSCSEGCLCPHCSKIPDTHGKEKQIVQEDAELEIKENRGQLHTNDSQTQHFLEVLQGSSSDSDNKSVTETDNYSKRNNEMISD